MKELSIWSGNYGTGKTTLLSELSLDWMLSGVPTLWGSFEIGSPGLIRKMIKQYSNYEINQNPEVAADWVDKLAELPLYLLDYSDNVVFDDLIGAMEYACHAYDVQHIILDNLQFFMGTQFKGNEKYDWQDVIIERLRQFTREFSCHISLVVHPRKYDDTKELTGMNLFGSVKTSQEASNIFIIQNFDGKPHIVVDKCRETGGRGPDGKKRKVYYTFNPLTEHIKETSAPAQGVKQKPNKPFKQESKDPRNYLE